MKPMQRTLGFAQAKVSLTERDSIFGSYTDVTRDVGEGPDATRIFGSGTFTPIVLRQFGVPLDPNRTSKIDTQEGVLGYQHLWRPGSALTAAVQIERTVSRDIDPDQEFSACTDFILNPTARSSQHIEVPLDRRTFQVQQATRIGRHQVIGGALVFRQDKERRCNEELYLLETGDRFAFDSIFRHRDHLYRGYVRDEIEIASWLHATIGVTYDDVRFGSMTDAARVDTLSKLSPQGGVTVRVAPGTLVRAAAFRSVAGDIFGSKIAPVTVAGFVLERNEFPTTMRDEVNVSIEKSWARAFAMGRWFLRDARVPALEDDFLISPNADTRTQGGSVFYNRILSRHFGAFVDDQYLREKTLLYVREDNVARAGISFVHERGVFAKLSAGYFSQRFVDAVVRAAELRSYAGGCRRQLRVREEARLVHVPRHEPVRPRLHQRARRLERDAPVPGPARVRDAAMEILTANRVLGFLFPERLRAEPGWSSSRVAAAIGLVLALSDQAQRLDWAVDDRFVRVAAREPAPPDDVVIVAIDEPSFSELQRPWPWPRRMHGALVDALARGGARTIVFDVVFDVPAADPEDDRLFVEAVRRAGNVIVAADVSETSDQQYAVVQWAEPFDALAQAVAGTGAVKLPIDPDGVVRRGGLTVEGRPGLAFAAAQRVQGAIAAPDGARRRA